MPLVQDHYQLEQKVLSTDSRYRMVHDLCKYAKACLRSKERLVAVANDHELEHQLPQPPSAEPPLGDLAEDAAVDGALPGSLHHGVAVLPVETDASLTILK